MNVRIYYRSKHKGLHRLDLDDRDSVAEAFVEARSALKDPELMLPQPEGPLLALIAGESV